MSARGKFLVNVGRGAVVDEEGLYLALRDGILKGAAIDTWCRYPRGGSTSEVMPISMDRTCENIARFLRGEECESEVDLRELY